MANAKDIDVSNLKLKVLPYGKSGTGKTTFACTFPNPYVFDFDAGMLSQRGFDVEYDTYTDWAVALLKIQELERNCPYDTLVFDSITNMQELMMDNILKINNKSIATQYEWGQLILQLSDIFMRLTQIKKHIICIAHEIVVQDDITSEILVLPLIYGKKLPGQLPLWFDEVYRMQVAKSKEGPVYQAMTTATTKYTAKSRLRVLDTIEVPNYNSIMEKVKNG